MTTNIFLVGMPSSGKSTLGRQIAKSLGYEFIDLDVRIEVAESKKIAEIFSLNGEEYFRKIENQQLKKIQKDSKMVVATGGGTPCFHDGLEYIKKNGISIFLDVKPAMLVERMRVSKKNERPLFDLESKSLLDTISEKYNERLAIYQKADITVEGDTDPESILWIIDAEFSRKNNCGVNETRDTRQENNPSLRFKFADIISVRNQNKESFAKNSKGFFMAN